ncbi:hypothetical protein IPM19_02155 [bacterium]|nr:MAG: hypothetical protein IPM19_02155 [bacterium]
MLKIKQQDTIKHGDVIEGSLWGHQVNQMILNLRTASLTIKSWELSIDTAEKLRVGYVIVYVRGNSLAGLIRDTSDRFRLITFPQEYLRQY